MKATITLNGVSVQKNLPTSWDDVTFAQFLKLEACGTDIIKVIALFTGTDYDTLRRSKIHDLDTVVNILGFLSTKPVTVIPKTILGYKVPEKLEFEQVQMYLDLKNYVNDSSKLSPTEQLESYTLYCAVYACREKFGEYDWKKAESMKDEFLKAPCTEVMGIGNFTLLRLIGLKRGIDLTSPNQNSPLRKLKLVLTAWRIRMVLYLRSFSWRKELG